MAKQLPNLICAGVACLAGAFFLLGDDPPNPNLTGGAVAKLDDSSNAGFAHFRFRPGSRTKWHSPNSTAMEGGQIILVEERVGLTQVKGGPVLELHAGGTTYVGPGVVHWHGAAPDKGGFNSTSAAAESIG